MSCVFCCSLFSSQASQWEETIKSKEGAHKITQHLYSNLLTRGSRNLFDFSRGQQRRADLSRYKIGPTHKEAPHTRTPYLQFAHVPALPIHDCLLFLTSNNELFVFCVHNSMDPVEIRLAMLEFRLFFIILYVHD